MPRIPSRATEKSCLREEKKRKGRKNRRRKEIRKVSKKKKMKKGKSNQVSNAPPGFLPLASSIGLLH